MTFLSADPLPKDDRPFERVDAGPSSSGSPWAERSLLTSYASS